MVAVTRRHDPDPAAAAVYDERHETFESTLEAVRPMWERLTNEAENRATDD
jgi:sugar (pentulose or hexulose) kinase